MLTDTLYVCYGYLIRWSHDESIVGSAVNPLLFYSESIVGFTEIPLFVLQCLHCWSYSETRVILRCCLWFHNKYKKKFILLLYQRFKHNEYKKFKKYLLNIYLEQKSTELVQRTLSATMIKHGEIERSIIVVNRSTSFRIFYCFYCSRVWKTLRIYKLVSLLWLNVNSECLTSLYMKGLRPDKVFFKDERFVNILNVAHFSTKAKEVFVNARWYLC